MSDRSNSDPKSIPHPSGLVLPQVPESQLELGLPRVQESDRNLHLGGRSFYFFDFDDNVAFLSTALILFHKETGEELAINSGQYARENQNIGVRGVFQDYERRWDDTTGTYRNFRDHDNGMLEKLGMKTQIFLQDLAAALGQPDFHWKGPSWSCFYHATFNQRPVSVITARGHHPSTVKDGIGLWVDSGYLPQAPNYLSVFPVSHPQVRLDLGDHDLKLSVAELKQKAIRASLEMAIRTYGYNPHHRFGMSDDDPRNIQLIVEEMRRLKTDYPELSFFMIETHGGDFTKHEITHTGLRSQVVHANDSGATQALLFDDNETKKKA